MLTKSELVAARILKFLAEKVSAEAGPKTMNYPYAQNGQWWLSTPLGFGLGVTVALLVLWSLAWKGIALWKSARHGHNWWFIALLVINTAGILDILYIYVFSKKMSKKL